MTTKITEQNISQLANAGVNWQPVVTADGSTGLTAVAGRGYFIDTTSGAQTVTLPASPKVGDVVVLKDYARTWATNNITIASNTFDGATNNPSFSTNGQTITLVYMDNTRGWSLVNEDTTTGLGEAFISATGGTITTSGDFKIHAFTGDGCFVVTSGLGNLANAAYLVVAGGGGGGFDDGGGAGGGGYRFGDGCTNFVNFTTGTYSVTVGAGGAGGAGGNGSKGIDSVISTITSTGGGAGGGGSTSGPFTGQDGGSGGAGGQGSYAGQGNTPPVSPPQGSNAGSDPAGFQNAGAGGGGAGAIGQNAQSPHPNGVAGNGGNGSTAQTPIFGTAPQPYYPVMPGVYPGPDDTFSGGGGGGANSTGGSGGTGGGGLGRQSTSPTGVGVPGATNHGGGGGGGANFAGPRCGGSGGSGIVLIRYKFQ